MSAEEEKEQVELAIPKSIPYMDPGMPVTTIEIPAMGDLKVWHNVIYQLQAASGVVVLRGLGVGSWDKDIYLFMNDIWAEICEIVDARPTFIINIAKGDVRSMQCTLAAISDVSLASPDATFGFPEAKLGGMPAVAAYAMRKRVADGDISRLISTGEPIDAREAQRLGLVDFVGDVELELTRLLFKNCRPRQRWKTVGS
mmetsp:Transcript_89812/g.187724  ORF Transcript_89812/g.187724 Transcript_89812/m.187724 type:complete len:199 (-) Transcript_89812:175-771(-)|eukprot:CAMPEP_0206567898 /NCGR_PEP_ID=MMETSP0325_2-20121206/25520_1 /ASSEMBLY_ACC=CAM_ASM_000347 /TAXON_ID=2866 /ORGANISM="Crypthecodinium cohnii, Strain Seligo" /LENGTH=198 /DNA_ID=CAMNT_0054071191 /DNA_START=33 /DNA_END=629 /DNA_ORIENTATION=+